MTFGSSSNLLIVLRGPSGSGKSRTATVLRKYFGRGLAIVRQDVVRRDILKKRDQAAAVNIGLTDAMTRHILDEDVPCVVEGITCFEARFLDRAGQPVIEEALEVGLESHSAELGVAELSTNRRLSSTPSAPFAR